MTAIGPYVVVFWPLSRLVLVRKGCDAAFSPYFCLSKRSRAHLQPVWEQFESNISTAKRNARQGFEKEAAKYCRNLSARAGQFRALTSEHRRQSAGQSPKLLGARACLCLRATPVL